MSQKDPIQNVEQIVREVHDSAGKITQPVLRKYPLVFATLIIIGISAFLHGLDLVTDQFEYFHSHPYFLIVIGVVILFFTGMLYKSLERMK